MAIINYESRPFGRGPLTVDGIQWSEVVDITTGDRTTVESAMIWPPRSGMLLQVEFELWAAFRSSIDSLSVLGFDWEVKSADRAWASLVSGTISPPGVAYVDLERKGLAVVNTVTGEVRTLQATSLRQACRRLQWPVNETRLLGQQPVLSQGT